MWDFIRANPIAFSLALLLHMLLIGVFIFNLDVVTRAKESSVPTPIPVKLAKDSQVQDAIDRLKAQQRQQQVEQEQAKRRLAAQKAQQRKQQQEKADLAVQEAKRARQQAEKKAQLKKQQEQQAAAKAKEATRRQAEAKKKEIAKRKAAEKKKAAENKQRQQALQTKRAREKKEKAQKLAEAKRLAEEKRQAEARRQAQAQQQQAQREKELVSQYTIAIKRRIESNWRQPLDSPRPISCVIRVKLIPGGEVISAKVVRSSGHLAFDRSVEAAVYKTSPLPLPPDPKLFNRFRDIQLEFQV